MDFLRDPIWTFISVIVALIAVCITIVIYLQQRNRKEITWGITSNTLVLPVPEVGEHAKSKLQVLFEGKTVDDLRLVILALNNTGDAPIEVKDFENNTPISFDFGDTAEILYAEILETKPESLKSRVQVASKIMYPGKLIIEPLLLNSKDTFTFKVLLIKFDGHVNTFARISGVKDLQYITVEKIRDRLFLRLILLLLASTVFLILATVILAVYRTLAIFILLGIVGIILFIQAQRFKHKHFLGV